MRRTGITRFAAAAGLALASGGVLAVSGVAGTGAPVGNPAAAAFRLADGSAGCVYADGQVACRADGAGAVVLEADGSSHAADPGEIGWDESTPILLTGESWWNGEVSCRASETELTCSAGSGELRLGAAGAGGAASAALDG